MKTTYIKNYQHLSTEEEIRFRAAFNSDACLNHLLENLDGQEQWDVQVAFEKTDDGNITPIDYRIFDPMRTSWYNDNYINPEGWTEWQIGGFCGEECIYEEDCDEDADEQTTCLSQLDMIETEPVCVSEGQDAPTRYYVIDEDHCLGSDGCLYQLIDNEAALDIIKRPSCAPTIISRVGAVHYTVKGDVYSEKYDGLYVSYAEEGGYGEEVFERVSLYKTGKLPVLIELSEDDVNIEDDDVNWNVTYNGKDPDASDNAEVTYGPAAFEMLAEALGDSILAARLAGLKYIYESRYDNGFGGNECDYYFWSE